MRCPLSLSRLLRGLAGAIISCRRYFRLGLRKPRRRRRRRRDARARDAASDAADDARARVRATSRGSTRGGVRESATEGVDHAAADDECGSTRDGARSEISRLRARSTRANAPRGGRCRGRERASRVERRKTKYESEKSREIVYLIEESECVEKMSGREGRGAAGAESKSKRSSGT
tara:strand:+ start:15400 stop:15927 length:528 start_codon:yes stop_codon:yes gene_type:complete